LRTSLGHLPDEYVISEIEVFKELSKIKLRKSVGPDTIPHKILKNLADVLAASVTTIINASLRQGIVHELWKISKVTVVPQDFPPINVESDIRPISVTNTLSKIGERFVSRIFNEKFDNIVDSNKLG
jgi:hypothetical protein